MGEAAIGSRGLEAAEEPSLGQIIKGLDSTHPMHGVLGPVFKHRAFLRAIKEGTAGLCETAADLAGRVCEYQKISFAREDWDRLVDTLDWEQVGRAAQQAMARTARVRVHGNAGYGSPAGDLMEPVAEDVSDVEIPDVKTLLGELKGEKRDVAFARSILEGPELTRWAYIALDSKFRTVLSLIAAMKGKAHEIARDKEGYDAEKWEATVADLQWDTLAHSLVERFVIRKEAERYQPIFEQVIEDEEVLRAANDVGVASESRSKWIEAVARRRAEEILGREFVLDVWLEAVGDFDWASLGREVVDEGLPDIAGVGPLPDSKQVDDEGGNSFMTTSGSDVSSLSGSQEDWECPEPKRSLQEHLQDLPGDNKRYQRLAHTVFTSPPFYKMAKRDLPLAPQVSDIGPIVQRMVHELANGFAATCRIENFDEKTWSDLVAGIDWADIMAAAIFRSERAYGRIKDAPSSSTRVLHWDDESTPRQKHWYGQLLLRYVWDLEDLRRTARCVTGTDKQKRRAIADSAKKWAEHRHLGLLNCLFANDFVAKKVTKRGGYAQRYGVTDHFDTDLWRRATREVDWLELANEPPQVEDGVGRRAAEQPYVEGHAEPASDDEDFSATSSDSGLALFTLEEADRGGRSPTPDASRATSGDGITGAPPAVGRPAATDEGRSNFRWKVVAALALTGLGAMWVLPVRNLALTVRQRIWS